MNVRTLEGAGTVLYLSMVADTQWYAFVKSQRSMIIKEQVIIVLQKFNRWKYRTVPGIKQLNVRSVTLLWFIILQNSGFSGAGVN